MERWLKAQIEKLPNGDYKVIVAGRELIIEKDEMDNLFNSGQIEASAD